MSDLSSCSAEELVRRLEAKLFEPTQLTLRARLPIVSILRLNGYTQSEMAALLQVTDRTIARDVDRLKQSAAQLVQDITVERAAGELVRKATYYQGQLVKKGEWEAAWRIECQLTEKLQSLGVLKTAPIKFQGVLTWEEVIRLASSSGNGFAPHGGADAATARAN